MGCSNPHPHGQVWAQRIVPQEPAAELAQMREYHGRNGATLPGDQFVKKYRRLYASNNYNSREWAANASPIFVPSSRV